jgi:glyoxylase-like metal-dependent hydrolase (beta-lactamase superfamily II)
MPAQLQPGEVAPNIYRLASRRVNFYLVRESSSLTLIDTGLPRHWPAVGAACQALGLDVSAIDAVLLTHVHADHAGTAERARTNSHAEIRLHRADAELTDGRTHRKNERGLLAYLWRPAAVGTLWELAVGGGLRMPAIVSYTTVEDGEVLDVPGRPRAVHLPGHTKGSLGFVLADRDACFTGDALVTLNLLTGRRGPQLLAAGFSEDSRAAMDSLSRIAEAHTNVLLPGHGEPWRGPISEAVDRARAVGWS